MMAKCPWLERSNDPLLAEETNAAQADNETMESDDTQYGASPSNSANGNPLSYAATLRRTQRSETADDTVYMDILQQSSSSTSAGRIAIQNTPQSGLDATIRYLEEYRREYLGDNERSDYSSDDDEADEPMDANKEYDDMENFLPKYLICIGHVTFPKKLDPGPSLKERIAAKKAEKQNQPRADPDWWNYEAVSDRFDKFDKVVDGFKSRS